MAGDTTYQGIDGQALLFTKDGSGNPVAVSASNPMPVDLINVETVTLTASAVTADTELPPAAPLADGTANPTEPGVAAHLEGFNGTSWDRLRASIANGLLADVARIKAPGDVVYGTISVLVTATLILAAYATRRMVTLYNNGTGPVYIGTTTGVTTGTGFVIPAGASFTIESTGDIYGIAGATTDVRYWSERY